MHARVSHSLAVAVLVVLSSTPARAQIRASELGSVSQTIDGTKITMQYSRPRARGRNPLFGTKIVQWDEVWTPGANWATTFEASKDVTLEGHRVPQGKYSVWMVVKKQGDWTLVLDPTSKIYHMDPPDSNPKQVRFPVHALQGPFTEVLTWSVPDVRASGGTLAMDWGTVHVPIKLDVAPSLPVAIAEADAQPFLGRYEYVEKQPGGKTKTSTFTVLYENGTMKGEWFPEDNYMKRFALIRIAPDWFVPGLYDKNGEIYEVLRPEMVIEFTRTTGKATSLVVRNEDDGIDATGTRKP
ncbi:MAG: DUF2911 domain-containing protein [bacterium]